MVSASIQAFALSPFHFELNSSPDCRKAALLLSAAGRRRLVDPPERRGCRLVRVHALSIFSSAKDTSIRAEEFASGEKASKVEDIVIVGGGIAGLATALAFHRMGRKSLVLEQSPTLRATGTSLGVWTNGWRALEALGVGQGLKDSTFSLRGMEIITAEGKILASLPLADEKSGLRFQGVERKILLETLLEPLPAGTVRFDSRVVEVSKIDGDYSQVELSNGSTIQAKVLIGCDGIGSAVAKYLGLEHPRYCGYMGIRGMGVFSEEHGLRRLLTQIVGKGVRTGYLPLDSKRVYWFIVFNKPIGSKITDLQAIKEEALSSVQGVPEVVVEAIRRAPLETLSRAAISDRWMLPFSASRFFRGGITVAGDAMHPVTPNLAQGGCCALEDAVILARRLSKVINSEDGSTSGHLKRVDKVSEMKRIEEALSAYASERQERMLPLAATAYSIGALLQIEPDVLRQARDFVLSTLVKPDSFGDYTTYDCGKLA